MTDQEQQNETEPKIPAAAEPPRLEALTVGDCGFLPVTYTNNGDEPEPSVVRSLMFVRVVAVEDGAYRVSVGDGLTMTCAHADLRAAPTDPIARMQFAPGDIIGRAEHAELVGKGPT
jgi:hypothetical protein